MYVCICARVREADLRAAIRAGARTVPAAGETCGAGTGCGSCRTRIGDLIAQERLADPAGLGATPVPARA